MLRAATLWAGVRQSGLPTTAPQKLDIDVIMAAQALEFAAANGIAPADSVIATSNAAHLSRFANAAPWEAIAPG